jgi:hypothetical protein
LRLTDLGRNAVQKTTVTAQEKLMQALQDLPLLTASQLAGGLAALIDAAGLADETPVMFFELKSNNEVVPE